MVKEIENLKTGEVTKVRTQPARDNQHDPANLAFVKSAMEAVLKPGGTAARIGAGLSYRMAGKTGTAQVVPSSKAPSTTPPPWLSNTATTRGLLRLPRWKPHASPLP